MRVLHLSKFFPPVMGGIETVAWELVEGLTRLGVQADVLCSNIRARTEVDRTAAGYSVWRSASWGRVLSTSVAPAMMRLAARLHRRYDLIHIHMPDPMAAMALCAARPGCRVVVHWHSDVIRQRRAMVLYQPLQDWLLRRADAVIATSPPYAESSLPLQPWRHKVHVIPIGISDQQPLARAEEVSRIRARFGGRKIVFALGRMAYYKGFDVLVKAAVQLPQDCVVVIGGEGEVSAALQARVRELGLQSRVVLAGPIADAELASHYAACDVFCMPSLVRAEAYGVATVEAMCMGKPVVSSHIPGSGVSWVNVDALTGLSFPAGDADALASAVRKLLESPDLRQAMGTAARHRYEAQLTAQAMVRSTLRLYQALHSPELSEAPPGN